MMYWHHCEEVKQVSAIMGSVNDDIITLLNIYYFRSGRTSFLGFQSDRISEDA